MAIVAVVQHRIRNYADWREIYDEFADVAQPHVGTPVAVYRALHDPATVLVIHSFETAADAELFSEAAYMREVMHVAGVEGQPRIELYEEA